MISLRCILEVLEVRFFNLGTIDILSQLDVFPHLYKFVCVIENFPMVGSYVPFYIVIFLLF